MCIKQRRPQKYEQGSYTFLVPFFHDFSMTFQGCFMKFPYPKTIDQKVIPNAINMLLCPFHATKYTIFLTSNNDTIALKHNEKYQHIYEWQYWVKFANNDVDLLVIKDSMKEYDLHTHLNVPFSICSASFYSIKEYIQILKYFNKQSIRKGYLA